MLEVGAITWSWLGIKLTPYLIALIFAIWDFPSRLVRKAQHGVRKRELVFAERWAACCQIVSIPLVTLGFAGANILLWVLRGGRLEGLEDIGMLVGFGVLFLAFVVIAMTVLTTNLGSLPDQRGTRDLWIKIVRVVAVMICCGADVLTTTH